MSDAMQITAINPGPEDYRTAGRIAGSKAAAKLANHILRERKLPSANALVTYHAVAIAAIAAQCDRMLADGGKDANLSIWVEAYVKALRAGFNA
jgi:hypothetical protein